MHSSSQAGSSFVKPSRASYAPHSRLEVQKFATPQDTIEVSLDEFWQALHYEKKDFNKYTLAGQYHPQDDFTKYMEIISKKFHKKNPRLPIITFNCTSADIAPSDHPTTTKCRPDLSAYSTTGDSTMDGKIHWSQIDATVELHSGGVSASEGPLQAASYLKFLLQARPDRISIQGFYADKKGVILLIGGADGIKRSPKLNLSVLEDIWLVHASMKRLASPHPSMLDPSIRRRATLNQWVFDITLTIPGLPSVDCCDYTILKAHDSAGRRTHIFANNTTPAKVGNIPIPIIKDQYLDPKHRFEEAYIICHIHKDGNMPGVIHLAHSQNVVQADGLPICCGDRNKKRVCLSVRGKPFMDLKTPMEVLAVIYDLLETTRVMYNTRHVLHRDISTGNIMYIEKCRAATSSTPPNANQAVTEFCSVNHLLNLTVERTATSNILIDFDRGEITTEKLKEKHLKRTGTPMFMARAVRSNGPIGRAGAKVLFSAMPKLSPEAHKAYGQVFPERIARFQCGAEPHIVEILASSNPPSWRHELCHDAESAFWVLVWWAVNAYPNGGAETCIPATLWSALNDTSDDDRSCNFSDHALDPAYSPLLDLLNQLGESMMYDFHWATKEPYTHREFLHEAFQRHILNFIFANQAEPFMSLPKADKLRKPAENTQKPDYSASEVESMRGFVSVLKRSRDSEEPESSTMQRKSKSRKI